MVVAVTQNLISIFRVWCDESKEEVGAGGGEGQPQHQVIPQKIQQQKVLVGGALGRGNYKF